MPTGVKNLTKGNIFKQLVQLALPIMGTSFVQMAYSLTDMGWVGRLGSEEVAAVGAVGILLWLCSSAAMLSKVAAEVSIGQSIGANKKHTAMAYASHATTIGLIASLLVMAVLFFGADFILSFFKLSTKVNGIAVDYLHIVCTAVPFAYLSFTFSGIYNGAGRSNIPFYITATGLACNMLLDPLFIFGFNMGTNGAAIATWIAQALVFSLFVWQMRRYNGILNRFPMLVRLRKVFTLKILRLGFPIAIMNLFFAAINTYMARVASIYGGHIGLSTQTVGGQIEGITWNTSSGFSTALGAFSAQNFAAGKPLRARKAFRYTLTMLLSLGAVVTVVFVFFGKSVFGLIVPEQDSIVAGGEYLMIVGLSQIFMMLEMTTQGMFNGAGRTVPPAIVSVTFNLARVPLALILAPAMGLKGVWWAISISSIAKGVILPLLWRLFIRKK